jgi:cation:H+ antiporter
MILNILAIIFLIILFLILSKSADIIVLNLKKIGERLGIKIFFLGIILGIMTSLPEMAIGINSVINDVPTIAFGHLMGGIIVLLGLVLSISIILNRKMNTDARSWPFMVTLIFLFLPLVLGAKGELNFIDGIVMTVGYFLLIYCLYKKNKGKRIVRIGLIRKRESRNSVIFIILGLVGIIITSNLILKTTLFLMGDYDLSEAFIVGLLFYSIGTNLPELTIALRSFKRKTEELSFSNLLGAAMAHVLILGILSLSRTIQIEIDFSYIFLTIFSFVFLITLFIFYKTDRLLSRIEGIVLLCMYLMFVFVQTFMQISY